MFSPDLLALAEAILAKARSSELRLVTAESCTGGLVAGVITEIPGSSDVLDRGVVTYSDRAKTELLGVPASLIAATGAVSEEVARAMAEGAIKRSGADLAVAVTGIAGPGGGSSQKPVGLVHFAAARKGRATIHEVHRFGDIGRREIRMRSVMAALKLLEKLL
jgi:nicotinamide-nucleotide amidase